MTALQARPVPGSRAAAPEQLQWLTPAPLWNENVVGPAASGLTQPWIAELTSDQFVPEFLGILSGTDGSSPADLANTTPDRTVDDVAGGPFKLFQPLSQRYYMVAASLVCRRPGIPDHSVSAAKHERTTFVMRQIGTDGTESAWVPARGASASGTLAAGAPPTGTWVPATADAVVDGEEQLPMHAAPVGAFAAAGSTAAVLGMQVGTTSTRTVYYGYVPVGRRERMVPSMSDADAVAKLKAYNATAIVPSNPIADELLTRIINPWDALLVTPSPAPTPPAVAAPYAPTYASLFLILDLADWLKKYLPELYTGDLQQHRDAVGLQPGDVAEQARQPDGAAGRRVVGPDDDGHRRPAELRPAGHRSRHRRTTGHLRALDGDAAERYLAEPHHRVRQPLRPRCRGIVRGDGPDPGHASRPS